MDSLSPTPSGQQKVPHKQGAGQQGRLQACGVGVGKASDHKIQICTVLPYLFINLFIYLAASDLSCSTWALCCNVQAPEQGSPTSRPQTHTSCQISGSITLEIKCTINAMCLNHLQTTPSTLGPWKNCLPQNWPLVPKCLGTAVLEHTGSGVVAQT